MHFGAAKVEIVWPVGLPMAGYSARTAPATGIHQPLSVRAVVASTSNQTICLLSLETLCVDAGFTAELRTALAHRYGLRSESVMVTATHTHAAPAGTARFTALGGAESFLGHYAPDRVEIWIEHCINAVGQAMERRHEVRLLTGTGRAVGVGKNRRDPGGPNDPDIPALWALAEQDALIALLYSFPCHPTILNAHNTLYSGDLAGTTARVLESQLHGVAFPITGAAGDISTRFTRRESSIHELDRLAGELANGLVTTRVTDDDQTLAASSTRVVLPLRQPPDRASVMQALDDAQSRLATADSVQRRLIESEIEGLRVALAAGPRPNQLETEVQALRLGHTVIVGLPGELFVRYGLSLRQQLFPAHVLIAGYTNDYIGYVPTPDTEGGYEADSALVDSTAGQRLVHAALQTATACLIT